jgi:hypothetical protein
MPVLYFTTKDAIPAELQEGLTEVKEDGEHKGKFSINVVPKAKLDSFRETNISTAKLKDEIENKLKALALAAGVNIEEFDPAKATEEFARLRDTHRKVSDGNLKTSDEIEKEVEKRTAAQKEKHDQTTKEAHSALTKLKQELVDAKNQYKKTFIDRGVMAVLNDENLGLHPTAAMDIVERVARVFKVNDDNTLTPYRNGDIIYSEDSSDPQSVREWIDVTLRKEAPHYFKKSQGGGGQGGTDAGGASNMSPEELGRLTGAQLMDLANKRVSLDPYKKR